MRKRTRGRGANPYQNAILDYAKKHNISPQEAIIFFSKKGETALKRVANELDAAFIGGGYPINMTMDKWIEMKQQAIDLGLDCDIRSYSSVKSALKAYRRQQAELARGEIVQEEKKEEPEPVVLKGVDKQYIDNLLSTASNVGLNLSYDPNTMTLDGLKAKVIKRYTKLGMRLPKLLKEERVLTTNGSVAQAVVEKAKEEKQIINQNDEFIK